MGTELFFLDHLPARQGGAAENMAADFLLLKRYPEHSHLRFRHYGWHRPAFTFGFSQKIAYVRSQLPSGEPVELCRRVTGGGVVDHRNDWTYSLVIPRGHPLFDLPAPKSYEQVHRLIATILRDGGEDVILKEVCDPDPECPPGPTLCFKRPERFDVVRVDGRKVAGAAQKRTKEGLLFQGSIDRNACSTDLDWDTFEENLAVALAHHAGAEQRHVGWPEFAEGEWETLTEQYGDPEWQEAR